MIRLFRRYVVVYVLGRGGRTVHLAGGCRHSHLGAEWPWADDKTVPEVIAGLETAGALEDTRFCYHCFGRGPRLQIEAILAGRLQIDDILTGREEAAQ